MDHYERQRQQDRERWLRRLATLAENPISARVQELERITQELDKLEGWTCTGRVHWRDTDKPGKTPKMYVIHGIDKACPLHGSPEPGERLRVYVGTGEDKQEAATAAILAERERRELERCAKDIGHALDRCGYHLRQFYEVLGYTVPRQNQPALYPEPVPNWKPGAQW